MARGRGRKIDFKHWTAQAVTAPSLAAGTVGVTVLSAQHLPETLLRTRGEWCGWLEGVQTGGAGVILTAGLILVPEGTGSTVLWSPVTDSEGPWLWWDTFSLGYEEYVMDVIQASQVSSARRVIDSHAMRKVVNMELQAVFENVTGIGASSVNAQLNVRVLAGT